MDWGVTGDLLVRVLIHDTVSISLASYNHWGNIIDAGLGPGSEDNVALLMGPGGLSVTELERGNINKIYSGAYSLQNLFHHAFDPNFDP